MRLKSLAKKLLLLLLVPFSAYLVTGCSEDETSDTAYTIKPYSLQNIEYARNTDTSSKLIPLTLDIYFPEVQASEQKFPLIMLIHGGSYLVGSKEDISNSCELLSNEGFVVAAINYRLGWRTNEGCSVDSFSLAEAAYRGMQDANAALRYLVSHASQYGIDTAWIFTGGESAGAAIALNSSYITDHETELHSPQLLHKLGGLRNSGNNFTGSYSIKGICNKWGAISDTNLITGQSKIPVISFHGTNDPFVPAEAGYFLGCTKVPAFGSVCIHRQMIAAQGISNLYLKPGGLHQPSDFTPEFTMEKTAEFFRQIMSGNARSAVYIK